MFGSVKKVLFLYAHPHNHGSRANRLIAERVRELPNVTFHSLYEEYPEFYIDVAREQKLLLEHQVIVWQHPLYWYSMPPLLKLWIDQVFEFNFAYGPDGQALRGKQLVLSVTAGGSEASFAEEALHGFPFDCFLYPYRQTARLSDMTFEEPLVLFHALGIPEEKLKHHALRVKETLERLSRVPPALRESADA